MTCVRQSSDHKHVICADVRRESTRTGTYLDEKHGCAEDIEYDDSQRDILWQENQMQQKQRDVRGNELIQATELAPAANTLITASQTEAKAARMRCACRPASNAVRGQPRHRHASASR